jgi:hypothetical protein
MPETKKNSPTEEIMDDVSVEGESDDEDLDLDEGMMEDDGLDLGALLTTEDGETIPSVLSDGVQAVGEVARQISVTNKLLVKLISKLG